MANSNIELGKLARVREPGPALDDITVPARYVAASGEALGSQDGHEPIHTSLPAVTECNPNVHVSAKVPSNHGAILRKDFGGVADAVREVAALDRSER